MSMDRTVLEEDIDKNYEPTDEEIAEYASWLGIDLLQGKDLLWIAKEGLQARLPAQWKPCRTEEDEIYYFNFDTGESSWNHPCDEFYRNLYRCEGQKLQHQRKLQQMQNSPKVRLQNEMKDTARADEQASSSRTAEGVESSYQSNENEPGKLVVRWKTAMSNRTPARQGKEADNEREQKKSQMRERVRMKMNDEEQERPGMVERANQQGMVERANQVMQVEDRNFHTPLQAEMLEKIKKDAMEEQESRFEQGRKEISEEVERQLEAERKCLQERDKKRMEQDLQREREFLIIQEAERRQAWEAQLKVEEEAHRRMNEEFEARRQKREEEFRRSMEDEIHSFESDSRNRLEFFRQDSVEKESELMKSERERMIRRVHETLKGYEKLAAQKMKNELRERAEQTVCTLENNAFEKELEAVRTRVRERVELEAKLLQNELEKDAEIEMAQLRQALLKEKRDEMLRQVHEIVKFEQKSEMEKMEKNIKGMESLQKRKGLLQESEILKNEIGISRPGSPEHVVAGNGVVGIEEENKCKNIQDGLMSAVQKVACEVLSKLVVRDNKTEKKNCSCEDRYREIKDWMIQFEDKIRKLVLMVKEDTKEAAASFRTHLKRNSVRPGSCSCDGNTFTNRERDRYRERLRPCFCTFQATDTRACMGFRKFCARDSRLEILLRPRRYTCSCNIDSYYDDYRKDKLTQSHLNGRGCMKLDVDTDSDFGISEVRLSRVRKFKRQKPSTTSRRKYTGRAVAGSFPMGRNSEIGRLQRNEKMGECRDQRLKDPDANIQRQANSNFAEPPGSGSSNSSSKSGDSNHSLSQRRHGGKLKRLRKGLFIIKGKLLKWSRKPPNKRIQSAIIRKSDIAKIQLECRKKLRQLPIGIRWKVARLIRRSPQASKHYCRTIDDWPNLEFVPEDVLDEVSPVVVSFICLALLRNNLRRRATRKTQHGPVSELSMRDRALLFSSCFWMLT